MRADRLLSLLILLQQRGRTSAQKLAQELEVSERTIYRDLLALNNAGIPIYTERGPNGGCELLENYRTTLTGLTESEQRVLFMLTIPEPLNDLGLRDTLRTALLKMAAALPGGSQTLEARTRQRIYIDSHPPHPPQSRSQPAPHLLNLYRAIWNDQRVQIAYRLWFGSPINAKIDPYGLVARGSEWHLVYRIGENLRVIRAADLEDVQLLPQTFERIPNFNLADFWETWRVPAQEAAYPVSLRVSPQIFARFAAIWFPQGTRVSLDLPPADQDGWRVIELNFESLETARAYLLNFGGAVQVLAPEALRLSLCDFARQILLRYPLEN